MPVHRLDRLAEYRVLEGDDLLGRHALDHRGEIAHVHEHHADQGAPALEGGPVLEQLLGDRRRDLLAEGADDALALLLRAEGIAGAALDLVGDEPRGKAGGEQHRRLGEEERRPLEGGCGERLAAGAEIGRASCRERGWMAGGRGRRRHTRCLSDWSSDVCSSDLCWPKALTMRWRSSCARKALPARRLIWWATNPAAKPAASSTAALARKNGARSKGVAASASPPVPRSEERRVGKEGGWRGAGAEDGIRDA